jgi:hypothetical protein
MDVTADKFEGMLSSVVQSQDAEVTLGKQPVMAEYGREVRAIVSALPPEVSQGLMNDYKEPEPQVMASMEGAIMSRELAVENVTQEVGLDKEWLSNAGAGRQISENQMGASDDWNGGPAAV